MYEQMLLLHGAPTLAGMKTGSLFTCPFRSVQDMRCCLRRWNRALVGKGMRTLPLRHQAGKTLVYIYRRSGLLQDLQRPEAQALLRARGYCCHNPEGCILRLMERLEEAGEFPHEIGLFLGYPPEDVQGFIENKAGGFKCAGCWKVYGDPARAEALFAKYRRCTQAYCSQYAKGVPLDRLAVAG